jgi:isoleucyl-tRNA synthetase
MLAPVLAFSADEAWEFVPGKTVESVHQAGWEPSEIVISEGDKTYWKNLFSLRETVLQKLEDRRQRKHIGKSLDAFVTIVWGTGAPLASIFEILRSDPEPLRELLNVSSVVPLPDKANPDTTEFAIDVLTGRGEKCERCWHWETDVGSTPDHPTICARCVGAVKQAKG